MSIICPKCGRSDSEVRFIDAFCIDDYPVKIKVPDKVELEQCGRCQRVRLKGDWTAYNERKIIDYIISKCKGDFESATYNFEYQVAGFKVKEGNSFIDLKLPFEMKKTICQQCSRISGGYFEAIIQLRGDRSKMDKYAEMLMKKLERKTFIAKTEEKDEGIDLYIGNSKTVVALMGELGVKTLITKKLVGRDQGKRLYRTTFLVRV